MVIVGISGRGCPHLRTLTPAAGKRGPQRHTIMTAARSGSWRTAECGRPRLLVSAGGAVHGLTGWCWGASRPPRSRRPRRSSPRAPAGCRWRCCPRVIEAQVGGVVHDLAVGQDRPSFLDGRERDAAGLQLHRRPDPTQGGRAAWANAARQSPPCVVGLRVSIEKSPQSCPVLPSQSATSTAAPTAGLLPGTSRHWPGDRRRHRRGRQREELAGGGIAGDDVDCGAADRARARVVEAVARRRVDQVLAVVLRGPVLVGAAGARPEPQVRRLRGAVRCRGTCRRW